MAELDVKTGDEIRVIISTTTPYSGTIGLENLSTGQNYSLSVKSPTNAEFRLKGKSAEWVVESFRTEEGQEPLVDFGTVVFSNCSAETRDEILGLGTVSKRDIVVDGVAVTNTAVLSKHEVEVRRLGGALE
ncbi:peptidase G1 [Halenospora varia]|nr:peptidase G1 [Halenospora varia]